MISYYLPIGVLLSPWVMYVAGSAVRMLKIKSLPHFVQLICALLLLLGSGLIWLLYDPNFGLDPFGLNDWSHTAVKIEGWVFLGATFIFYGITLIELKLIRSIAWWRRIGKVFSLGLILSGAGAAYFVSRNVSLPWLDIPWGIGRAVFTLLTLPHALAFLVNSFTVRINPAIASDTIQHGEELEEQ